MSKEEFVNELLNLNIVLNDDQIKKLNQFYNLVISWNKKINLTTIIKEEDFYLKHFYDSLTLVKAIDLTKEIKVLDVGTGAGFPGIVLKIVFPNLNITLLDSLNKRIKYLNEIIKELDLKNIKTVCMRAEEYTKNTREEYDLVVSRAVAHLKVLTEISFSAVKVNGYLVAMKSIIKEEIKESNDIIKKMNGEISSLIEFNLPKENSKRTLVKIEKKDITPFKYPRRYSEIKKC